MRLAIIGNSHLAALKLAIKDRDFDVDGDDVVFWGQAGSKFKSIRVEGGQLTSRDPDRAFLISDNRYRSLPLDEFDVVAIHGPVFRPTVFLRSVNMSGMDLNSISAAFLDDFTADYASQQFAVTLAKDIQTAFPGPILVSAPPLLSQESNVYQRIAESGIDWSLVSNSVGKYFAGLGFKFVPQPAETIVDRVYTHPRYSVGSRRLTADLDVEHEGVDYGHMNADYGVFVLRDLLAAAHEHLDARSIA